MSSKINLQTCEYARKSSIFQDNQLILFYMKNKLDRFDDDWKWDVLPTRMLYELLLSPTYRWPWKVKIVCSYRWGAEFPKCPRCGTTMEREYQRFCDRCGQRLSWRDFDDAEVIYVGWDGPDPDNLP